MIERRTTTWGWMTRWMAWPAWASALVTESTRNGMSSVTTSTTVWPEAQPFASTVGVCTRTAEVPWGRLAARARCDSAAP